MSASKVNPVSYGDQPRNLHFEVSGRKELSRNLLTRIVRRERICSSSGEYK